MAIGATVVVLLLLWLVTVGLAGATVVKIEPSTQNVLAGEGFSVDVTIEDVTDMAADGAILHFDSGAMQAANITAGVINSFPVETIDNEAGAVTFGYAKATGSFSGSGALATIDFTADASAEGVYNLNLTDVELIEPDISAIPIAVSNGTVTVVGGPTPTPTPSPSPTAPPAGGGGGGGRATPTSTPLPTSSPEITLTPIPTQRVTPTVSLPVTPSPTPSPSPSSTPTPKGPGFEAVFAIAGLLAVAYLTLRSKKKR